MQVLVRKCAGIDVHRRSLTVCIATKNGERDQDVSFVHSEHRTFRAELRKMAEMLKRENVELVVMEATGIYWRTVYEVLEDLDVTSIVVNAQHVKNVPGRKTDVQDAQWLSQLGMFGLLRASFIPPRDFREIRMLTRYRVKLVGIRSSQKNRISKTLDDCGVRLGCVVSDIDGVSAKLMIDKLIDGKIEPKQLSLLAKGRLKAKKEEIEMSLDGRISDRHRFILKDIRDQIRALDISIQKIDEQVEAALLPHQKEWNLLQTIPGIDNTSAAMLLAEVGTNMKVFGSKEKLSSWAGLCPGNNESAGKKSPLAFARETHM